MIEQWKPIDGFNGLYEISDLGRCRSFVRCMHGRIMKPTINTNGYAYYTLGGKLYRANRLVAKAFIPNPNNLPCVDHINAIRDDNRVENLRWATMKENMNNPLTISNFEIAYGDLHIAQYSIQGKLLHTFHRAKNIKEIYPDFDLREIRSCCRGRYRTSYGFVWKYYAG